MNISTYEARIAALEAQLGPEPGPGQETGLVSVVVTPDINLSDGTTLNAKLAELVPMEFGDTEKLTVTEARGAVTPGNTYSVTVTPAASSVAIARGYNPSGNEHGEPGAAVTISVVAAEVAGGGEVRIKFDAGAAETFPPESAGDSCIINVKVQASDITD